MLCKVPPCASKSSTNQMSNRKKTFNHCICISSAWVHTTQQNFKYLMQFNWIHLDLLTFCFPTLPPPHSALNCSFFPSNLIAGFSRIWYFIIAFIEFARLHPSLCFLPNRIWSNLALTISPSPSHHTSLLPSLLPVYSTFRLILLNLN